MNPAAQIRKQELRKRRRAAERMHKLIEDLHRRQAQADRDRRRKWLLLFLLWMLESTPVRAVFNVEFVPQDPVQQKRQPPPRKFKKNDHLVAKDDPRSEYERQYFADYSTRYGEEELEVYDGLTWNDIVEYNRIHRPHLFPLFKPIPGMPDRYKTAPAHIWTLLDHIGSDYHRSDAITALKLITDESAHDWIDACSKGAGELTWKDLRKCRSRTPDATIYQFPRYAERWREEQRREAEERRREAKDAPDSDPKPPGLD